jgi:hypothetical protein
VSASHHTTAATVAPKWARRVDTVELDAEKITFERGDRVLGTRSLRSGKSAITILGSILGTGSRTSTQDGDGGVCLPASTSYNWDDALRVTLLTQRTATGNDLDIRLLAPYTVASDGRTITLQGPGGVQVGDDITAKIASTRKADKDQLQSGADAAWQVVLQTGWTATDSGTEVNGASALTSGTTVTVIGAPMPIRSSDDC